MSILGAVGLGVAGGVAMQGFLFNYTKSQYENKISELETLIARLNEHLTRLRDLRAQVPQFWDDDNARETSQALDITIQKVEREMGTAESLARTFKVAVNELDGSNEILHDVIEDIKNMLGSLEL